MDHASRFEKALTKAAPKVPVGRPVGTTKHPEKTIKKLTLRLTPTGYAWVKAQGRGFLSGWIESQARKKCNPPHSED